MSINTKHFDITPNPRALKALPQELLDDANTYYERLKGRADEKSMEIFDSIDSLHYILGMSDFVAKTLIQYPKQCADLLSLGVLDSEIFSLDPEQAVDEAIIPNISDVELKRRLRIFRRTRMVPIAWRDLTGRSDIEETFVALSNLAECIVIKTLKVIRASMYQVFGDALDKDGKPMPLLILGMGKLGGGELNFSSDIDLVCCYPYDGETVGGTRQISHQEFFSKIVQKLSNLLSDVTIDSFCYRIDLRLRPFGDAGPLVSSFDALSVYYETQGRTWERYALVKAKLLGDFKEWGEYGDELIELLRPFVYRRYLDFGAIESLRKLKHMIEAELRRKQLNENFKLGAGGIREVEFIAQVFELMRGGRIPELAERSLRKTLKFLAKLQLLPADVCAMLDDYYVYLRRLENSIQEIADMQTQNLPVKQKDRLRVTIAMNKNSWQELVDELNDVMQKVHDEFIRVIKDDETINSDEKKQNLELWESDLTAKEMAETLKPLLLNVANAQDLANNIVSLKHTLACLPVGPVGRETLVNLMPMVIKLVAKEDNAAKLFAKVATLIERVALRTTYLQLLAENSQACRRMVSLLNENEFAGALISAHPILLDELIAPHYFNSPPKPDEFLLWLGEKLMRIEPDDLEGQMEELRLFKKIMVLRIAMSDRAESLPLMKISDSLTWLAEAIIREISALSWNQMQSRYGVPPGRSISDPGFAIIGYGKLGGLELGYKSDLDMVFICDENSDGMTDGEHPVSTAVFYQRLVQRLLHLSTTRMSGGVLYDLDMRLRPDGDSGLLVTDIEGFSNYQKERAWTWEHQALVRARAISGSKSVIAKFNAVRDRILRTKRDEVKLRQDVIDMRNKMRAHICKTSNEFFDLKHGLGGMVDIEFIAQYLLLKNAPKYKDMILWSDNVRIFDECERFNILSKENVETLKNAYLTIRGYYHRLSLADLPRIVSIKDRPLECDDVVNIWKKVFEV